MTSAYERARLANIARNEAKLRELKVGDFISTEELNEFQYDQEDKICTKERTDAKAIFSKFRNGSNERDRNRITEIGKLVAQNRDSIQKLILEEEMEAGR